MQFFTIQELNKRVPAGETEFQNMMWEEQHILMGDVSWGYFWVMANGGVIVFDDESEWETWKNLGSGI